MMFDSCPRTRRTDRVPTGTEGSGRGIPDIALASGMPAIPPDAAHLRARRGPDSEAAQRARPRSSAFAAERPAASVFASDACRAASSFSISSRYAALPLSSCLISRTARLRRRAVISWKSCSETLPIARSNSSSLIDRSTSVFSRSSAARVRPPSISGVSTEPGSTSGHSVR